MRVVPQGLAVILLSFVVAAPAAARTDEVAQLTLEWPAAGTLTAPFGEARGGHSHHPGVDIGTLHSLDVRAAAPGRVVKVGWQYGYEGYGTIVEVALGSGFTALYAHLADARVRVGQDVVTGQQLGLAGCTGWCTGTHLHFELRLFGQPVDPIRLFTALGYNRSF
jgi:murein DD-endopeptidase MepM/ murein hydrolase activator NlpD